MENRQFYPNTFQTPNVLIDVMPSLSESELRILIAVIRKTYGWHKPKDKIAQSQYRLMTGLSKPSIQNGVKGLIEKGLIEIIKKGHGRESTEYAILLHNLEVKNLAPTGKEALPLEGKNSDLTGKEALPTKPTKQNLKQKGEKTPIPLNGKSQDEMFKDTLRESIARQFIKRINTLEHFNEKFNKSKSNNINATINQYSLEELWFACVAIDSDLWSIQENMVYLNRLITPKKREDNMRRFCKDYERIDVKIKRQEPDEYEKALTAQQLAEAREKEEKAWK